MVDGSPELNLINPLTRAQIQLPPIDTFPDVLEYRPNVPGEEYLIFRVVLSSSPTSNECRAMAIFGEFSELAFCKYGDNKWTLIDTERQYVEQDFMKILRFTY
nr:putative f-box protein [Quercus suber]